MKMQGELIAKPLPPCRVILCTCTLITHKTTMDVCPNWLCICGNSNDRRGFKFDPIAECIQCHRKFDSKTGLLIREPESQLRLAVDEGMEAR